MNNFKKARGFTLIELMIVVAIIAILAAIAIPAYQDYIIRAQVSEGANLVSSAKISIAEYENSFGVFPADNAEAGLPLNTDISGKYVNDVAQVSGLIDVTFRSGAPTHATLQSANLEFSAFTTGGAVGWTCRAGSPTIANKHLPSACRP